MMIKGFSGRKPTCCLIAINLLWGPILCSAIRTRVCQSDFLVQSFDGLISTAEICCDGSTVAHGSDGALLAPSSIDLSSLNDEWHRLSSTVPFDGELTGFSKDPSRSDLFQLSFDLEKSGASDSAIATSVTGLAVLEETVISTSVTGLAVLDETVSSSEKIWLGNFLLGYVAGGRLPRVPVPLGDLSSILPMTMLGRGISVLRRQSFSQIP